LVESLVIAEEMKRLQTAVALAHSAQLDLARIINTLGGAAFKPSNDTKDIVLDPEQLERTVRIGAGLSEKSESTLVDFLRENRNIFAGSTDDLVGVPRELVEHSLHIRKDAKLVKQPLRRFAEDRRKIIGEEVTKLLVAGFIVEVLHTEWLANPVPVEKKKYEDPKVVKA
jgi:ribosomal protein S16